jgi:hypothetical protein
VSETARLRTIVTGLIGFAATEEEMLLASVGSDIEEPGNERRALTDEDLLDPARHPWLNGRTLWLQVIVRGFWHPTGHVADYYLRHGRPGQAVALQEHAVATARYLKAPDQATGMAAYSLACAQAQAGLTGEASRALAEAIRLNPDVRANATRDPDLARLRETGQLAEILTGLSRR